VSVSACSQTRVSPALKPCQLSVTNGRTEAQPRAAFRRVRNEIRDYMKGFPANRRRTGSHG
jgi:hypothetical protein